MPTYTYETIPKDSSEEPVSFEIKQSIMDDALTEHPETGQAIRRIITGGISISSGKGADSGGGGCCGNNSCGCG